MITFLSSKFFGNFAHQFHEKLLIGNSNNCIPFNSDVSIGHLRQNFD